MKTIAIIAHQFTGTIVNCPIVKSRLDRAIELYKYSQERTMILLSGRITRDNHSNEIDKMIDYLICHDIIISNIIIDYQTSDLFQNILNLKKIIDSIYVDPSCCHLIIVTSDYNFQHVEKLVSNIFNSRYKIQFEVVNTPKDILNSTNDNSTSDIQRITDINDQQLLYFLTNVNNLI